MPTLYRYTPHIEPGPTGRVVRFSNTAHDDIHRVATLDDGMEYISVPDGVSLPAQPDEITLEQVDVTPKLRLDLIRANVALHQSKGNARERVRDVAGDAEDQIAELEKRLSVMERILYQLAWRILDGQNTDDLKTEYGGLLQQYVQGIDSGTIQARSDLHYAQPLVNQIIARSNAVTDAVSEHAARINALLP